MKNTKPVKLCSFTDVERKEIVKMVLVDKMKKADVARQYGVTFHSIYNWCQKFGKEIIENHDDVVKNKVATINLEMLRENEKFLIEAGEVKEMALRRLKSLVPVERKIEPLLAAIQVLHNLGSGLKDDGTPKETAMNIFNVINQQIVKIKKGEREISKPIIIEGSSQND